MKKILVLNTKINVMTSKEAIEHVEKLANTKKPSLICTPNTEFLIKALKDPEFQNILNNESKMNLPVGFSLLWAAKFNTLWSPQKKVIREILIFLQWIFTIILIPIIPSFFRNPIPERISGSNFIWTLARFAQNHKYRLFLLGGASTVAERTALMLQTKLQDLRITGVHSGSPKDTPEILNAVNKSKTDILLVAFGAPKQEKWLVNNIKKTNCKIGIGVGGTFDFISGVRKRAPSWMQKSGLEWFFRLIYEPKRIKRQLVLPYFLGLILVNRIKKNN